MNDTHPKIQAIHLEMLRSLSPEARLKLALRFSKNLIDLSRKQFVARHGKLAGSRHITAKISSGRTGQRVSRVVG